MDTQEQNKAMQEIADGLNQLVADGKHEQAVAYWKACSIVTGASNAPFIRDLHILVGDQLVIALQKTLPTGSSFGQLLDCVVTHTHPNTYVRQFHDAMEAAYDEMVSNASDSIKQTLQNNGFNL